MKKSIQILLSILVLFSACKEDEIMVDPCTLDEFLNLSNCNTAEPNDSNEVAEIFKIVQLMPAYPGCDSIFNSADRINCNDEKIADFVKENLIYPQSAIDNNIEGTVVASFIVNKNGCLKWFKIITSVECEIDREALRILSLMPDWHPGKQRDNPVKVQYNVQIEFKL